MGIDAEVGRLRREDGRRAVRTAPPRPSRSIGLPYYATYFRWREAEAMLDAGDRPAAAELLKRARATATTHGFAGLDTAIVALARAHQLRLGPARTTVDGDEALSVRELEVLRLVAIGKSNPDIAETPVHQPPHRGRARVEHPAEAGRDVTRRGRLRGSSPRDRLAAPRRHGRRGRGVVLSGTCGVLR